jgi:hypothetical protein
MLRKIYNASPVLAITGWLNVAALIVMLAVAPFDQRLILGINPWIKPMKFATSIAIYVWTVAWMLEFLPRKQKLIEWGVSATMVIEIVLLILQSARGTTSHFNQSTPLNAGIFSLMGTAIAFNTVLIARLLWLYRGPVALPTAMLWGVRLGLGLFLVGSMDGIAMVLHGAHTVGMADGGPGLPLVNWSTHAGDLRIAHFLGLHGLQLLPLAGWFFERQWPGRAVAAVFGLFAGMLVVFAITLVQATAGRPLIGI